MMKCIFPLLVPCFLLFISQVQAKQKSFETSTQTDSTVSTEPHLDKNEFAFTFGSYFLQSGDPSTLAIGQGNMGFTYGRVLFHSFEIASTFLLKKTSDTSQFPGETELNFTIGPVINFPTGDDGITNAFFIFLGAGIRYERVNLFQVSGTNYATPVQRTTAFAYNLTVGKRFNILPSISWSPAFSIYGFIGTDVLDNSTQAEPTYSFQPIRVSIVF